MASWPGWWSGRTVGDEFEEEGADMAKRGREQEDEW